MDEDPNVLRPLRWLLAREGFRMLTAPDGQAALAAAAVEIPGLIVTDWMMPRIDGIELHIATGQANVKAHNWKLRDLIAAERRQRGMPISTPEMKDGPRSC
ncbi:response regulator [Paraburkholderia kirstenboschensis]|uniref:Response regulator n=1 Tax=Paraburkholderia kirstenboschensis TaxID=1245436 RepID=A0ABZ0EIM5_9BURK|nr:response regulator [Paraburkholderia kirstenboschensis]WOD17080.1 response regulator [Paraburkholderia kirstenboschensis]